MTIKYSELTLGQIEAIGNKLNGMEGIRRLLTDELEVVDRTKRIVSTNLVNAGITLASQMLDPKLFLDEMVEFYGQVYDIKPMKLLEVSLPKPQPGFCWGLIMIPGITIEQDLTGCNKDFGVWRWTDDNLDKITKSVRSANKSSYAVWLRDRVEADEEHKSKSYKVLAEVKINGINLPERIRLERWFYWRTKGGHLDVKNWTLCSGSLYSAGGVPGVGWGSGSGKLGVSWCSPGDARGDLRAREVVF